MLSFFFLFFFVNLQFLLLDFFLSYFFQGVKAGTPLLLFKEVLSYLEEETSCFQLTTVISVNIM